MLTSEVKLFLAWKRGTPVDMLALPDVTVHALNRMDQQFRYSVNDEAARNA